MSKNMEIGSEFHYMPPEGGMGISLPRPGSLVFSGRTAIDAVLDKISGAKTALLPAYCCDSMIDPFRRRGFGISFYSVEFDGGFKIRFSGNADILLWCNYFGFRTEMPDFCGIIMEDITHSLLSDQPCHEKSDYLVASVRKWMPLYCGGYCSVPVEGYAVPSSEFTIGRNHAMRLKASYLSDNDEEKKKNFLPEFARMNEWLAKNYSGLLIDEFSYEYLNKADTAAQKEKRRSNAHALYSCLKGKITFMFPEEDMDCPLFVPVILKDRDVIKKKLASSGIYCPSHWPHPQMPCESNLYGSELSLICDQRYSQEDMERISYTLLKAI